MEQEKDWAFTDKGTLYSGVYDDIYFRDGEGLAETQYVFLKGNQLAERLLGEGHFTIGELGFGTGLNFLCTWKLWLSLPEKKNLTFISCEKHPLDSAIFSEAHSCFPELKEQADQLRASLPLNDNGFHLLNFEGGRIRLILLYGDAVESLKDFDGKADAWFLDGFSPSKNPEMWSQDIFEQVARHSNEGATFATFTAAGFVRRGLKEVGFDVERIKGYGHKRHMAVGKYSGFSGHEALTPPWFRQPKGSKITKPRIAILGAGFAGSQLARVLSRFDCRVTVFDRHEKCAQEGSGNQRGILYPLLSKKTDLLGTLTKIGFSQTLQVVRELGLEHRKGFLELASDTKKAERLQSAAARLGDRLAIWQTKEELQENFGVTCELGGVFIPEGADLDPRKFVESSLSQARVEEVYNTEIAELLWREDSWTLKADDGSEFNCDIVICANAMDVEKFPQTSHFPLRRARGQVVILKEHMFAEVPKQTLNFSHYLTKSFAGESVLGATFDIDDKDPSIRVADRDRLVADLREVFPQMLKSDIALDDLGGRTAFRCTSPDFKPVVGPVPREDEWLETFAKIPGGQPWNRYGEAPFYSNLYVDVANGARGLLFAPLMAELLAAQIFDLPKPVPISIMEKLHPGRFLVRQLKKR